MVTFLTSVFWTIQLAHSPDCHFRKSSCWSHLPGLREEPEPEAEAPRVRKLTGVDKPFHLPLACLRFLHQSDKFSQLSDTVLTVRGQMQAGGRNCCKMSAKTQRKGHTPRRGMGWGWGPDARVVGGDAQHCFHCNHNGEQQQEKARLCRAPWSLSQGV